MAGFQAASLRRRMRTSAHRLTDRPGAIALALLLAGVALVLIGLGRAEAGSDGPGRIERGERVGQSGESRDRMVIAKARLNDFRVKLTAVRAKAAGPPPSATVRVAAFRRSDRGWRRLGRPLVVGERRQWFWHVVTGRGGVQKLRLDTRKPETIIVRLRVSESIGPSRRYAFLVLDGRLSPPPLD